MLSYTGALVLPRASHAVFRDLSDAKRILREMLLLRHLSYHENVLWLLDIFCDPPMPRGVTQGVKFRDIYLVMDLMDTDLAKIIESTQAR